jgi:hypothetical protein
MECELNPRIPYTELSHIIKKQKEVCMSMCGRDRPGFRFLPCLLEKAKSKCYHLLTMVLGVIGPELAPSEPRFLRSSRS